MSVDRTTLALLTVQILFALHYVAAKHLLVTIPAPAWIALRVGGAAVLLLLLTRSQWHRYPRDAGTLIRLAILSVFGVVLNQVLFIEGLSRTVPSHSSLINTSIPVSTLLIAILLRHEAPNRRKIGAVALSLSGVLLLMGTGGLSMGRETVVGDLMCLANATSFSLFLVISRPVVRSLSAFVSTPLIFAFGSIATTAYGWPSLTQLDWAGIPMTLWALGAAIIVGPTVGAYFLNHWALQRVDSSRVALFIYLQFLLAAPLSAWVLGEELSWRLIPAAVLVFAGVALSLKNDPPPTIVPLAPHTT